MSVLTYHDPEKQVSEIIRVDTQPLKERPFSKIGMTAPSMREYSGTQLLMLSRVSRVNSVLVTQRISTPGVEHQGPVTEGTLFPSSPNHIW